MTIKSDLEKAYQKKVIKLTENVVKKTVIDIDRELVLQTPVDTGRAQSNWLPSIGTPRSDTIEIGGAPSAAETIKSYKINQTAFIANNLPYIQRLNEGYSSQQATPSWVDGIVMANKARMKQAIKAVKGGL